MSLVKRQPGKWKTQVMATTTFDTTCKRQHLEADLAAMLATSTELHVIPEEFGMMNSSGQNGVQDEFKAEVEVEGLLRKGPFNLSGNLQGLGDLTTLVAGSYQTHPQDFTSNDNISGGPVKETWKHITQTRRPQEVKSCPPSSSGRNPSLQLLLSELLFNQSVQSSRAFVVLQFLTCWISRPPK